MNGRVRLAICPRKGSFSDRWIPYCQKIGLDYKLVDCTKSDIIAQLADCDALMWHWDQTDAQATLFVRQLTCSLEAAGKKVFPNSRTSWHFDDKVGQKYLLEALGLNLAPTWVFYDRQEALNWVASTNFPKVFKLRNGAGSSNVRLVETLAEARRLVRQMFGRGACPIGRRSVWWDILGKLRRKPSWAGFAALAKATVRLFVPNRFERVHGKEMGYIYFQEFIPDNTGDVRVIVTAKRAYGFARDVRDGDFRASGSGKFVYDIRRIPEACVQQSFEVASVAGVQTVSCDFVRKPDGQWVIVEISYGYPMLVCDGCEGYWTEDLQFHRGPFVPQHWMVDDLVETCAAESGRA